MTTYRVVQITTSDTGKTATTNLSILWEGSDPDELSGLYPPSGTFGTDRLAHCDLDHGFIRLDFRFEQRADDGEWVECADFRRLIHPITSPQPVVAAGNRGDFRLNNSSPDDQSRLKNLNDAIELNHGKVIGQWGGVH